tara:strand:+ start:41460 stop:43337 length:1878 start_codon:yes stop_codon:yes gene_type:complete
MAGEINVASMKATVSLRFNKKSLDVLDKTLGKIEKTLKNIVISSNQASKNLGAGFKTLRLKVNGATSEVKKLNKELGKSKTRAGGLLAARPGGKSGKKNPFFEPGVAARPTSGFFRLLGKFRTMEGLLKAVAGRFVGLIALVPAASAVFLTLAHRVNGTTTEMIKLSKATGVSLQWMQSMTAVAKELGFNFENVNSLVEELNNKVGGQMQGFDEINLIEGLKQLELTFEDIRDLKPEEQFDLIARRTQELARSGAGIQQLGSAWDKIFGGEGNRIGANIALMKEDFTAIQERMNKITKLSNPAVLGAQEFTSSMNELTGILGKFAQEFFGRFGLQIFPVLKDFVNFLIDNTGQINKTINMVAKDTADILAMVIDRAREIIDWANNNREMLHENLKVLKQWASLISTIATWAAKILVFFGQLASPMNVLTLLLAKGVTTLFLAKKIMMAIVALSRGKSLALILRVLTGKGGGFFSRALAFLARGKGLLLMLPRIIPMLVIAVKAALPALALAFVTAMLAGLLEIFFPGFTSGLIDTATQFWEDMTAGIPDWIKNLVTSIKDNLDFSFFSNPGVLGAKVGAGLFGQSEPSTSVSNNTSSTVNNINNSFVLTGQSALDEVRRRSGGIQ